MIEQALYIDGRWRETAQGIDVRSPWDGALVGRVGFATNRDTADALAAARTALDSPLPAHERSALLRRAEALLTERAESFATTISREAGKPISVARLEVARALSTMALSADAARGFTGEAISMEATAGGVGMLAMELSEPVGVVAAITPFNFPLNLSVHKLGPALAAGCPVVWKPSERTPLTAVMLAELLDDAGVPAGMVNLVTGDPAAIVSAMIEEPSVALITFTGSAAVGWDIKARSPRKTHVLELGSNAAAYVDESADLQVAAREIAAAAFTFAGQACISTQRVYVGAAVANEFLSALLHATRELRVGDPSDPETSVGPMITRAARDRVMMWIEEACSSGARLALGGELVGDVLAPTVLVNAPPDATIITSEAFAPVLAVTVVQDRDEALRLMNDSAFGLNTTVYTQSIATALTMARALETGSVLVNIPTSFRSENMPYGGVKESGQGREGVRYAVESMTRRKLLVLKQ